MKASQADLLCEVLREDLDCPEAAAPGAVLPGPVLAGQEPIVGVVDLHLCQCQC